VLGKHLRSHNQPVDHPIDDDSVHVGGEPFEDDARGSFLVNHPVSDADAGEDVDVQIRALRKDSGVQSIDGLAPLHHHVSVRPEDRGFRVIAGNRVAFSVDDIDEALEIAARHGCRPLRAVATYWDVYKLTYVRGPSGILLMLAEALKKS
jgi:hypothetical protein